MEHLLIFVNGTKDPIRAFFFDVSPPQRRWGLHTREAAIGPNKPDRFRAEFLLFGLILAHLLIKSPLQPSFLSRNDARKRSVLCILRNGEDGCERSQDFDGRFN
jgi:hypothetical protein